MGLVSFYRDGDKDHAGRRLDDVLLFDDVELEDVHDYIQWIFPTPEVSAFQSHVPVLTEDDIATFRADPHMQNNMRRSFSRMMSFYGLEDDGKGVTKADNFVERRDEWLTPFNHNFLRITRILRSMNLVGLESEAERFFGALDIINQDPAAQEIIGNSYDFWKKQMPEPKAPTSNRSKPLPPSP